MKPNVAHRHEAREPLSCDHPANEVVYPGCFIYIVSAQTLLKLHGQVTAIYLSGAECIGCRLIEMEATTCNRHSVYRRRKHTGGLINTLIVSERSPVTIEWTFGALSTLSPIEAGQALQTRPRRKRKPPGVPTPPIPPTAARRTASL